MATNTEAFEVVPVSQPTSLNEAPIKVLYGQGTPDGDRDPFAIANKGTPYFQVDGTDDDTSMWVKVDEGGDDNDWVRIATDPYLPTRASSTGQEYGFLITLDQFFTGTAASKSYGLMINGTRGAAYDATGDSNDAALRIAINNAGQNDTDFILRGLNVGLNNNSAGTLGRMENLISAQGKSGSTTPTLIGLTVKSENYGTNATEFGVMDIIAANESQSATTSYGIRIRNDERSSQTAVQSAIAISSHASSGGFRELIDASGAVLTEYDTGTEVVLMKFQGANGTTYFLVHDTDAATVVEVKTSVS